MNDDLIRAMEDLIPHLRAYARSLTGNRDAADDLVQSCLLKAMSRVYQYQRGTNLKAWMFAILRNLFISSKRREQLADRTNDLDTLTWLNVPSPDQEKQMEMRQVSDMLQQIPEEQRSALILSVVEGLSYEEIADMCDIKIGTVKSRIARARTALRGLMGEAAPRSNRHPADPAPALSA